EELLARLVEASRNVPSDERQRFIAFQTLGSPQHTVIHPGLPSQVSHAYIEDIETLAAEGLLRVSRSGRHDILIDVTPRGYAHYKKIKLGFDDPFAEIESTLMSYINGEPL